MKQCLIIHLTKLTLRFQRQMQNVSSCEQNLALLKLRLFLSNQRPDKHRELCWHNIESLFSRVIILKVNKSSPVYKSLLKADPQFQKTLSF